MAYQDNFKVYGPYRRKDNRQIVIVERNGVRRTVSYPKWLLEVQLGRPLDSNLETVDHWDSNVENNDISNLRIVPRDQHSADDTRRAKNAQFKCAWCQKDFERSPRLIRDKAKKNKAGPFCSRSCGGKYSRMLQLKLIDKFAPQKHMETEYFKKKYQPKEEEIKLASFYLFAEEEDIIFEDLLIFVNEYLE